MGDDIGFGAKLFCAVLALIVTFWVVLPILSAGSVSKWACQ